MTMEASKRSDAEAVLSIENLSISFSGPEGELPAVKDLTLNIQAGEIVGLAGESGSGKTVSAMSILRLNPSPPAKVTAGAIHYFGRSTNGERSKVNLLDIPLEQLRQIRGAKISVIFQEPMTALSPLHRVGQQLVEALRLHQDISPSEAWQKALQWLAKVGIPEPDLRAQSYPFELSGGQRQRVMIAMALMLEPDLIIADEPTTALDVTIQKQIFELMLELKGKDTSMLFITHDMGVIWEMCDRVAVMSQGELVEEGEVKTVLKSPQHPYTQKLIAAVPALNGEDLHQRKSDELLLAVKDLHTWYPVKRGLFARTVDHVKAVRGISFEIYPGETLALVGESGCGKTTLGRTLMKLERAHSGSIHFEGVDLLACSKKQDREGRQHVQMVFQDPYSALNPRMKIWHCLSEALVIHGLIPASEQRSRAQALLEEVGLGAEHLDRYPHEFSGGQRQRICIARALGLKPKLIILDESLSALDVSIQAQVLDLLQDLKQRHDLAYLFISHDLSVVSQVADRIAVMKNGQIVEMGPPSEIVAKPKQAYTQALMASIPVLK